jgi:hypothetical protein
MLSPYRLAALLALPLVAFLIAACGQGPPASDPLPPLPGFIPVGATPGPGGQGKAVDCDRLLSAADLQAVLDTEVRALGWSLNSCYWLTPTRNIQLVLQTGPDAHRWFTILQQPGLPAGMTPVAGYDFEAIAKSGSFGGYAPGRAALLHSALPPDVAAPLVRQVLSRL